MPGVKDLRYRLHLDPLAGDADIFATFRAAFSSRDALDATLASLEGKTAQADVPAFADGGVTILRVRGPRRWRAGRGRRPSHEPAQ